MKYIIFYLTLLFMAEVSIASERKFKIEGKYFTFISKKSVLVNNKCENDCVALKRLKVAKFKKPKKLKNTFSMSSGSYHCKNTLRGLSILGIEVGGDMRAFCYFSDDESLIEINSLSIFLQKK